MLSVVIIAKNEEANIRRCLESVKWADEIVLVDSGSTDNTIAIAKEYTDKIYSLTDWQGYGIQKQRALEQASGDWVLNLDADESVDDTLRLVLLQAIKSGKADAYRIPVRMCFYDKPLRFTSSPKRHIRLFRREGARFSRDIVHEKILLPEGATIGQLQASIMHHSYRDISHLLSKINRYSSCSAKIRLENKKSASLLKTMLGASWMFFRCYIIQLGFRDGRDGLVLALFNAQGAFYRGIKQLYPDRAILKDDE